MTTRPDLSSSQREMREGVAQWYESRGFSPIGARVSAEALFEPSCPIASALAALERERDKSRAAAMSWKGVAERLSAYIVRADTELDTLRASAERMEAALTWIAEQMPATCEMTVVHEMAGRAYAALTPKETPDA